MKPTFRLILLVLIISVFCAVPVVHAVVPIDSDFTNATPIKCDDPTKAWPGEITDPNQIDYYAIDLVADQVLTIDVDADGLSSLDSLLEVFDKDGNMIDFSNDDKGPGEDRALDPYLEITADVVGTYYLAISAATPDAGANIGRYEFFLGCSDPSLPPNPVEPVKVGDLLGATGSDSGFLLTINPVDAKSTDRFPFGFGPVSDIEFDPTSGILFAATHAETASLYAIDPNNKDEIKGVELNAGSIIALEAADGMLYGVRLLNESFSLVTIDKENLGIITEVEISKSLRALAYHSVDKVMYGASGTDLVKISLTTAPAEIQKVGSTGLDQGIVALDFNHENILYAVDIPGNLYTIPYLNLDTEQPVKIGTISAVDELPYVLEGPYSAAVNGLTFVVGAASPDVEPIKTLCSSALTSSTTVSSETNVPKLSRLKLKKNPLHRAIGLFKFQGKAGEKVTLRLAPEGEEAAVAGEESSINTLFESWLNWRGKGRVFLGIRDAIPNVDFRARKKDQMPFDMSADLPEDGEYYVMVIRPLLRFYQTDYCLTLESDHPDSEAWQTLDVVWPGDDSEEDTATTSTETKLAEPLSFEEDVAAEESLVAPEAADELKLAEPLTDNAGVVAASEPESTTLVSEPATLAPEPTTNNVTPGETPLEPVTKVDTEVGQTVGDTSAVAPAAENPEEPTTEATDEPIVKGAPSIPEETAIDETGEVAPEESADEISGDNESPDGSGSAEVAGDNLDGAESAEGGNSEVIEEKPMTEVPTP